MTTNDKQRRTQVKDLPQPEKELSAEEQKRVKGGGQGSATGWPAFGAEQVGGTGGATGDEGAGSAPERVTGTVIVE